MPPKQKLYCICKQPYKKGAFMVACDKCNDWFHPKCVNITQAEAKNLKKFFCPSCRAKGSEESEDEESDKEDEETTSSGRRRTRKPKAFDDYVYKFDEKALDDAKAGRGRKPRKPASSEDDEKSDDQDATASEDEKLPVSKRNGVQPSRGGSVQSNRGGRKRGSAPAGRAAGSSESEGEDFEFGSGKGVGERGGRVSAPTARQAAQPGKRKRGQSSSDEEAGGEKKRNTGPGRGTGRVGRPPRQPPADNRGQSGDWQGDPRERLGDGKGGAGEPSATQAASRPRPRDPNTDDDRTRPKPYPVPAYMQRPPQHRPPFPDPRGNAGPAPAAPTMPTGPEGTAQPLRELVNSAAPGAPTPTLSPRPRMCLFQPCPNPAISGEFCSTECEVKLHQLQYGRRSAYSDKVGPARSPAEGGRQEPRSGESGGSEPSTPGNVQQSREAARKELEEVFSGASSRPGVEASISAAQKAKLALSVEEALFRFFKGQVSKPYAQKFRALCVSIQQNPSVIQRLITGALSPEELLQSATTGPANARLVASQRELETKPPQRTMLRDDDAKLDNTQSSSLSFPSSGFRSQERGPEDNSQEESGPEGADPKRRPAHLPDSDLDSDSDAAPPRSALWEGWVVVMPTLKNVRVAAYTVRGAEGWIHHVGNGNPRFAPEPSLPGAPENPRKSLPDPWKKISLAVNGKLDVGQVVNFIKQVQHSTNRSTSLVYFEADGGEETDLEARDKALAKEIGGDDWTPVSNRVRFEDLCRYYRDSNKCGVVDEQFKEDLAVRPPEGAPVPVPPKPARHRYRGVLAYLIPPSTETTTKVLQVFPTPGDINPDAEHKRLSRRLLGLIVAPRD